jgi:hypothetical protein
MGQRLYGRKREEMNSQWSDEVKERYIKDQAFLAECTARGIQICVDVNTQKRVVRNNPWVGLPTVVILDIFAETVKTHGGGSMPDGQIAFAKAIEQALKERNT